MSDTANSKFLKTIDDRIRTLQTQLDGHQRELNAEIRSDRADQYQYHANRIHELHARINEAKRCREGFTIWAKAVERGQI